MITTARCSLSAPTADDRRQLMRLYTDPEIRRFLGGPVDEEAAALRLHDLLTPTDLKHARVIRERDSGTFLGLVTIDLHNDGQDFELSCQLFPEHQGCGYATEALEEIVEYAGSL